MTSVRLSESGDLDLPAELRNVLELIQAVARATVKLRTRALAGGAPVPGSYATAAPYMLMALANLPVAGTQCRLENPPVNIQATQDSNGDLRYECSHPMPNKHCWTLNGKRTHC